VDVSRAPSLALASIAAGVCAGCALTDLDLGGGAHVLSGGF
jgi:hypothetical protein